ncbi:MAG: hypothetical protein NT126_02540 [Bacteroidetes bacterium]|nr:hypothetical protein [Bacteroidota bacterium]
MSNRRRLIIIISSVLMGTFFAFLLIKSRMGTLKPNDWVQLAFNFLFAVAIVVGVGFILKVMRDKNPKP